MAKGLHLQALVKWVLKSMTWILAMLQLMLQIFWQQIFTKQRLVIIQVRHETKLSSPHSWSQVHLHVFSAVSGHWVSIFKDVQLSHGVMLYDMKTRKDFFLTSLRQWNWANNPVCMRWLSLHPAYFSSLGETCPVALRKRDLKMKAKPAPLKRTCSKISNVFLTSLWEN